MCWSDDEKRFDGTLDNPDMLAPTPQSSYDKNQIKDFSSSTFREGKNEKIK